MSRNPATRSFYLLQGDASPHRSFLAESLRYFAFQAMAFNRQYRILRSIVDDPEFPDQEVVTDFKVESFNRSPSKT
jgi:hypothetical protein